MRNRKYIVDLNSKTYQVARYKQYDNNINYSIEVIEDGVLVDLDNCIVKAFFETPSKLILQKDCMVSDNTITTILDNNILGEAGKVLVEFTIYKSDIIVTTFTLSLDVEKSINKNDAIQKEPVWDIIANLLEIDETVRIKLEEVDNKIIETTEITNTNTSKIDNKILDIQNQLDSRISEKFTEIDNTLESKTTEKFIAVDEILNEKQTQIQEQVDNKISDADNKILDCEERMQNIESNFGDLVDGTGYATTEFVNKSLEQKSSIGHRHNVSEIDDLNMSAEDISMSDGSNVEDAITANKTDILDLKNNKANKIDVENNKNKINEVADNLISRFRSCDNIDTHTTSGLFTTHDGTKGTFPNGRVGLLIHNNWDANYAFQLFHTHGNGFIHRRAKYGNVWDKWEKIILEGDIELSKFTRNYSLNEIDISDSLLSDLPGGFTVGVSNGDSKGLPYGWCIVHQIGSGMTHFKIQVCYSASGEDFGKISIRQKYATTEWTAWKEVVNPYSYLNTLFTLEQQISEIEIQLMENEV